MRLKRHRLIFLPNWLLVVAPIFAISSGFEVSAGTLFGRSDSQVAVTNGTIDLGAIILRRDADRDAMPDSFENEFGLNLFNPADAVSSNDAPLRLLSQRCIPND